MGRLQRVINNIIAQLSLLTVSQRVSIALCAVIVVGSLLWLTQWSTTPEMVPLVNHDFTADEINAAEDAIRGAGSPYEIRGSRIFVREGDQANLKRVLYSSQVLPQERLFDMEDVIKDPNPFQSPEARAYAQNYARGNELAKIIATYPMVRKASVLINPSSKRRVGAESDVPTASVVVMLAPGKELTSEMVEGFAKLVSGTVAGLKPQYVNVTDSRTGETFNVPKPEDAVSFDYLRVAEKHESHFQQKILRKLADIPGVRVAVSVELDTSRKKRTSSKYEPAQVKSETTNNSDQGSTEEPAESGTMANMGAVAGNSAQKSTSEETSTDYFDSKLSETETVEQPPMAVKRTTAAVGIPRSFVVGVFQAKFPDGGTPKDDDPKFTALRDEEVSRVKSSIEKIVMARTPNDVQVDVYPDMNWSETGGVWNAAPTEVAAAVQAGGAGSLDPLGLVRSYGPQVGLSFLALTSLFMMMRIARRQAANIAMPTPKEEPIPADEPMLTARTHPVGQAEVSESLLTGREVDDTTLRYEEIGTEVSRMVEADPAGAADLIRRWCQEVK